ncbi:peptidoglycan-binding protein [Streptomyces sp. NPDC048172]|uniref:peptidoglycan-binding protein n=1 Tax=Streptomyces sp. NPDC048172 TaxID=3365505 RepID=UPI0037167C2D
MTAHDGENDDPLHIRPYVSLPEDGGTAASEGAPGAAAETTAMPDLSPFARQGTAETAELPTVAPESRGSAASAEAGLRALRSARTAAETDAETELNATAGAGAGASTGAGRAARSHRRAKGRSGRRRPATGVLAAAGVAAALGAGLLTTQALTGDRGGEDSSSTEDRALGERPTGAPTHGLASDSASPSPSESSAKPSKSPTSLPSRTSASGTPRADRNDDAHTEREAKPSPSASSRKSTEEASSPSEDRPERREERRPQRPERPGGATLNVGDSGQGVADLQRRLKQVGYLSQDAEEDGVYNSTVQEGVYRYQVTYGIDEDEPGAYGPYTRRSLESRT